MRRLQFQMMAAAALGAALLPTCLAQPSQKQPNIVYIVADDLGWKDVGFHGSDIRTPQIDKLASGGARLESFYTMSLCTPSRASLMTGRYPMRYGLQTGVILAGHTYGLPEDEYLLPQALKDAGYSTAIVGKWHLGHSDRKFWPQQRGFDYHYGAVLGEIDYYTHAEHGVTDWYKNNKKLNEKGYVTQLLGDEAVRLVQTHDTAKPLFLYLAFTAPHAPYQAPKEYEDRYKQIEEPTRRTYAAMISCMDDQIGRVVAELEKKGMRDNTLIVFMSDNGGNLSSMFAGELDVSKLKLPSNNGPYRGGKGMLYEGGTRVAALANWPGRIKPGTVDGAMHMVDMMPTLASLAGASLAKSKPLDGVNVWPVISEGKPSPRTEVVYNVEPFRGAVRQGDWKLIWRTPLPSALELYNVKDDPSEKSNVALQHPEVLVKLQARIEQLAGEMAKPMFLVVSMGAVKGGAPPALPNEEAYFNPKP